MERVLALPAPAGPPLEELNQVLADDRLPVLLGHGGPVGSGLSSHGGRRHGGQWNLLSFDPVAVVTHRAADAPVSDPGRRGLPRLMAAMAEQFGPAAPAAREEDSRHGRLPPFRGGALALLGYDLGRELERLPVLAARDAELPDLHAGLYPFVLAEEVATGRRLVVGRGATRDAEAFLAEVSSLARHARPLPTVGSRDASDDEAGSALRSTFDRAAYESAVRRVLVHIRAGDLYQVNLSHRFELPYEGSAGSLAAALGKHNPAPYASLLRTPDFSVISSSPELFLRRRGESLESCPIKGTRPRGADPAEDRRLRAELEASAKEHAELAMIVDLVRNDIGRSAQVGSVGVELPFQTDAWATVFHRRALVSGLAAKGRSTASIVEAAFPPASVTGAPKIRAMELIETLEPVRRHAYTGAIGWFDAGGDFELSVNIRIATLAAGRLLVPVGGGLTVGSDPAAEYLETLHKARALFEVLKRPLPIGTLAP